MNREHALFDTSRCVAAGASDTSSALVALDASMVIRNSSGEQVVSAEEFFVGPANDIENTTVLRPGDILVAVRIPNTWAGSNFYWEKIADRNVWDFSLVNIAAAFKVSGGNVTDSRIVAGAVQTTPRRLTNVENAIQGQLQRAAFGTDDKVVANGSVSCERLADHSIDGQHEHHQADTQC